MENLNKVQLTGEIQSEIRENHEWKSEKFYMFELGVKRKSGVIDKARIMVSERLIDLNNLMLGTVINIEGEIRTYNQHDEQNRSHLCVYIFSNAIISVMRYILSGVNGPLKLRLSYVTFINRLTPS